MHPDHIGDVELQYHLLQHLVDRWQRAQFSDFVVGFSQRIELSRSQSLQSYWEGRITNHLVQMRNRGWIRIFKLGESKPTEAFKPRAGSDFLFEITEEGHHVLSNYKFAPSARRGRGRKQNGQDDLVVPPISQLVHRHRYPKPRSEATAKDRIASAIVIRRGQQEFREGLKRCLITGCDAEEALEAAHIRPYCKGGTFDIQNGLLLRADIHTLFDLGLIAIDTRKMNLILSPILKRTKPYAKLDGKRLQFPSGTDGIPDKSALDEHREEAGL